MTAPSVPVGSNRWWTLLIGRLQQIQLRLPPELTGTIQFEVRQSGRPPEYRYLVVGPGKVEGATGLTLRCDEWVIVDAKAIAGMVRGQSAAPGDLRVVGTRRLLEQVLHRTVGAGRARRAAFYRGGA